MEKEIGNEFDKIDNGVRTAVGIPAKLNALSEGKPNRHSRMIPNTIGA